MKLVGRYLSPFVRRVAVSLRLLGHEYEQEPLATTTDGEAIAAINPVGRVPALVLDDGTTLVDSWAILDWLDQEAGPERALIPLSGAARAAVMNQVAIGMGVCEKTVAWSYEMTRRPDDKKWPDWASHLGGQIAGGLAALDAALEGRNFLHGDRLTQADVTAIVAYDMSRRVAEAIDELGDYPNLAALSARHAAEPAFAETVFKG